jgi:hypothetical protein
VSTRRVMDQEVRLSPDGSRVAYVVKAPNVFTNANDYQLYVRDVTTVGPRKQGRLLLQADRISGVRWLDRKKLILHSEKKVMANGAWKSDVFTVDVDTDAIEPLGLPGKIEHYSASANGNMIVFSVSAPANGLSHSVVRQRDDRGYPVVFGDGMTPSASYLPKDEIFVARRTTTGSFQVSRLRLRDSSTSRTDSTLRDVLELNLSPNGKYLLIKYNIASYPSGWASAATPGWGCRGWTCVCFAFTISRMTIIKTPTRYLACASFVTTAATLSSIWFQPSI